MSLPPSAISILNLFNPLADHSDKNRIRVDKGYYDDQYNETSFLANIENNNKEWGNFRNAD